MIENCRPISLLSVISKIFEKVIHNQISAFLFENDMISNSQYGFRTGHSTEHAALELAERVLDSFKHNEPSVGLFLDLSKAFDSLHHQILINKLKHYGLSNQALKLFQNYLSDRVQYVEFNGSVSDKQNITTGVLQGLVLGPLLFLLYVNDLPKVSKLFDTIIFADDTTLHSRLKILHKILRTLHQT